MRARVALLVVTAVATGGALLPAAPVAAATSALDAPCADVEVVYARGSGQELGVNESQRFQDEIVRRLGDSVTTNYYEVGTEEIAGYQYPAVDVGDPRTLVGAFTTAGAGNEYGWSVEAGVLEMLGYLMERSTTCPSARFVLGGYSQGAQVVGEVLGGAEFFMAGMIEFVALWGDPKLNLPEGRGWRPPACRGEEYSPWRRVVPDCRTDSGILQARSPYLPEAFVDKTGLWCNNDDFICGSSVWGKTAGHMRYANEGDGIDLAALEIAERLKSTLPPGKAAEIDVSAGQGLGTTGLDVVFLIDTTGSMSGRIAQARAFAATAGEMISFMRGRVALATYRDAGDVYTARVETQLDSDLTAFRTALGGMRASGGGDTPEALMHALMVTMNGVEWTPGATKAVVVLTDAGYHVPDMVDGTTPEQVAARALEIDPVNVYPVVPSWLTVDYEEIAGLTSGQVVSDEGDTVAALTEALTRLQQRPVALLRNLEYLAEPGQSVTFDASTSYGTASRIVGYSWDVDGDGVFDAETAEPSYRHTYTEPFDGVMQVRVRAEDGGIASASAPVHVSQTASTLPAAPAVRIEWSDGSAGATGSARFTWQPADDRAARWGLTLNGVPLGMTDLTEVTITELDRSRDNVLGVVGLTADDTMGEMAEALLPAATGTTMYSATDLTLTNAFSTAGPAGDVHVAGRFTCNSDVHIAGDVIAIGDVYLTNACTVSGDVRAGGNVRMDSRPVVGGDVEAVGDVRLQSTATVTGAIRAGGTVRSTDGLSLDGLIAVGAIGGAATESAGVETPAIAAPTSTDPMADGGVIGWAQWMNATATANAAPSWSAGLSARPGCVMAPWAASVNGATVRVDERTVVDARSGTSGCSRVSLQEMHLELAADLTIYADSFAAVNGMTVTTASGESHALRIVTPGAIAPSCRDGVSLSSGTVVDPGIRVTIETAGRLAMNGPVSFTGTVAAGCIVSSGPVSITSS